ncbi:MULTISPECIES: MFS transporter [Rhodococcus]|uniref:4-hydroxybenzoate transporter n=1 Tax=Rhodococcus aetherivorans TaxID=191292 RepID=A0A5M3Y7Z7_9NOCA|nr:MULTISPECIES: MFS transporter [Rhodococcus]ETT23900.1 major facilitator superfamily MFS_1 [Rhodococcus rhodochrous ATCC 21198]AKE91835.1 MFS transporter [Rhodococcus aetherivorans]MBC2589762.1 MFS transporter [Rhodococcus aetherivorans]NGP27033.1 aromatic acid/H+ symport family MFS transporter [Rhodococcus aetherivorans]QIX52464.1 aromatic acid/H+ symport family MFS transporter [Rhodococcus sp. DMU1]
MRGPNTTSSTSRTDEAAPNWPVLVLTFVAVVLDGYDTIALGLSVPALAKDWDVAPSHFTPALSLTSVGVALGYLACGRIVARFGARRVVLAAVVVFTVGSLLTAFASTITELTALRVLTGLGLGAVLPAAVSHATALNPARLRQSIAVFVTMGISLGALIAGVLGTRLIGAFGWESVFLVGAAASAVLLPLLWIGLPDGRAAVGEPAPAAAATASAVREASVARLFDPGLRSRTLLLWGFSFLMFTVYYVFSSWLPTLLTSYGFSAGLAPLGSAALGVGSIVGAAVLMIGALRFRMSSVLLVTTSLAIVFLVVSAFLGPDKVLLLIVFGGVGLGIQAGMIGQTALSVSMYPQGTATTAVGWSASMGRLGSVVGPVVGGALIGLGVPTGTIVLVACVPVLAALVLIAVLGWITAPKTLSKSAPPAVPAGR